MQKFVLRLIYRMFSGFCTMKMSPFINL